MTWNKYIFYDSKGQWEPVKCRSVVFYQRLSDVTKQRIFCNFSIDIAPHIRQTLKAYCWNRIKVPCMTTLKDMQNLYNFIFLKLQFWSTVVHEQLMNVPDLFLEQFMRAREGHERKHGTFSWTDDFDSEIHKQSNEQTTRCCWTAHEQIYKQQTLLIWSLRRCL